MSGQVWRPEDYARHAGFVAELGAGLLDLLAPRSGERILDLGCGDGALTERIAASGATVVGVDASPAMVEAARRRGLDAHLSDGHALGFEAEFDAVLSNAALHWMTRPTDVLNGVARALRSGGRFVAEFGGHGNVAAVRVALAAALDPHGVDATALSPWYFPTAEDYAALAEDAGLRVQRCELFARPTPLPTDMAGWLGTFAEPFFAALPAAVRARAREETIALLRPALCDSAGRWTADYVRLRIVARRTAA